MPMDKSKYPDNWDEIAYAAKERAGWRCQNPKCRKLHMSDGTNSTCLTVHHKDHDTTNNAPENLEVLCAACHLVKEREWKRSAKGKQPQLFTTNKRFE